MGPEIVVKHLSGSTLAGREQRFAKQRVVIGRHPDCDVAFDSHRDLSVSSRHAELYLDGDVLFVKDLNSRNGTYINSHRVTQPVPLKPEDTLHFGYDGPQVKVSFTPQAESAATPPEEQSIGASTLKRFVADAVNKQSPNNPMVVMAVVGVLALAAGGVIGVVLPALMGPKEPTGPYEAQAPVPLAPTVSAFGRLEPDGGLIDVSATAGEIVDRVLVQEGDTVTKDQELVYLRSRKLYESELAYAQAALSDAQAQSMAAAKVGAAQTAEARFAVAQTGEPLDLEIASAEKRVEVLKNNLQIAQDDTKRLVDQGDKIPSEQLARQRLVEKGAKLELEAAESNLQMLRSTARLKKDQARAQLESAQADEVRLNNSVALQSAKKNVERAQARLDLATIRSPMNGRILRIVTKEGSAVGAQPVLQMANTDRMYVNAEVYESDLQRIKVGQKVTVSSPALPQDLHGEVEKILWTVSREAVRSLDPTAPSDLRVIPVKVRLDKAEVARFRELLTRLINLQVDVYIEVGE